MSDTEQSMTAAPDAQPPAEAPSKTDADRVALLEAKNLELKEEKQKWRSQVEELQSAIQSMEDRQKKAKRNADLEAGNFQSAYEDLKGTYEQAQNEIKERDALIEQMRSESRRNQIRTEFMRAASSGGVINPDHLLALKEGELKLTDDGRVKGFLGGVETELSAYIEKLKQPGSGCEYFFHGSGARGMSAAGSTPTNAGGKDLNSMSFTERLRLEVEDPEQFARLKAAAG